MPQSKPVKRALISVSDKTDLVAFAKRLTSQGVELISTGGTGKALSDAGIDVTPIDQVTGFPEMMGGRLKTLHPRIHGGLLALRDNEEHVAAMEAHGIEPIDLVCVNLYPFERTVADENVQDAEAIEQIDIGGPSMLRSAAKNHRYVTVVTDPSQYDQVCNDIDANNGATSLALRQRLMAAAFARTAAYDTAIAEWFAKRDPQIPGQSTLPDPLLTRFNRATELRYGENPHQKAALYKTTGQTEASVVHAKQMHGKQLSFNNLYDANAALELVKEFAPAAAAVIKHTNPCGCATANTLTDAFTKAYAGDPMAAFGGIVALNRKVDLQTAQAITQGQKFLEVIVAPDYDDDAMKLLAERWKNVRVLAVGELPAPSERDADQLDVKWILGGALAQQRDLIDMTPASWTHQAGPAPDQAMLDNLYVAWATVKHVKSNAITIVNGGALVGVGAGQMDRVESCKIAIAKAAAKTAENESGVNRAEGGAAGSDAFFPFRDGPDTLIAAGVRAIVQPGGSVRDDQTIQACNDAGVTLMFTGKRHFRH